MTRNSISTTATLKHFCISAVINSLFSSGLQTTNPGAAGIWYLHFFNIDSKFLFEFLHDSWLKHMQVVVTLSDYCTTPYSSSVPSSLVLENSLISLFNALTASLYLTTSILLMHTHKMTVHNSTRPISNHLSSSLFFNHILFTVTHTSFL